MTIDLERGKAGTGQNKAVMPPAEEIIAYLNSASPTEIEGLSESVATIVLAMNAPSLKSLANAINMAYRARRLSDLATEAVGLIAGDALMLEDFCSKVREPVVAASQVSADVSTD